jgi:hypothetical protein
MKYSYICVRYEIPEEVTLMTAAFWYVTPCNQ